MTSAYDIIIMNNNINNYNINNYNINNYMLNTYMLIHQVSSDNVTSFVKVVKFPMFSTANI